MPIPTIKAAGVAKPKAQGQAITNTEIEFIKAVCKSYGAKMKYHAKNVVKAIPTTLGTKIDAILSVNR